MFLNMFWKKKGIRENNVLNEDNQNKDEENNDGDIDIDKFNNLNKLLFSTLNKTIKIALCSADIGKNEYSYKLIDYKLSYPHKSMELTVERKNDQYHPSFNNIIDINYSLRDIFAKIWIKMKDTTWRMYLSFERIEEVAETDKRYEKEVIVPVYEQYRGKNPLLYYLEHTKHYSCNEKTIEKLIRDKNDEKVYLLTTYEYHENEGSDIFGERDGTIFFIDKTGVIGKLFFIFKKDREKGKEYIYIVDIQNHQCINRGIGSQALIALEELARKYSVSRIAGDLSSVDEDHKPRQIHFYTKNGFTIRGCSLEKGVQI